MKQQYPCKPDAVEAYSVFGDKTDVIMRRNIQEEQREDNEGKIEKFWVCDEQQCRLTEEVDAKTIAKNFDYWWDRIYRINHPDMAPTQEERIQALESAMLVVMMGGMQ